VCSQNGNELTLIYDSVMQTLHFCEESTVDLVVILILYPRVKGNAEW
jgi:hypothetical protein